MGRADKKKFLLSSIFLGASSVIEKVVFLIANVIIARAFSAQAYGEYVTALGVGTFVAMFSDMGIGSAMIRALNREPEKADEYMTSFFMVKIVLGVLSFGLLALFLALSGHSQVIVIMALVLGVVRILGGFLLNYYSIYEARSRFTTVSVLVTSISIMFLGITIIVVMAGGDCLDLSWGRLGHILLFFVPLTFVIALQYKWDFKLRAIWHFVITTIPFSLSSLLGNINNQIGLIILPLVHGAINAGYYNNGMMLIFSLLIIPASFSRVITPHLFRHNIAEHKALFQYTFNVYTKLYVFVSFGIMMGLLLHADFIITLFFGQKYSESIPVLKVFAFSLPFIFNMNGTLFTTIDKQKINTLMDAISVVITLAACFLLIPDYKENGAAAAFVCSVSITYYISTGIMVKKKLVDYIPVIRQRIVMALVVCGLWYLNSRNVFDSEYVAIVCNCLIYSAAFALFFVRRPELRLVKELLLPGRN